MSSPIIATAQFHEKVEWITGCTDYYGSVVKTDYYVIVFTKDNWKTKEVLLKHDSMAEFVKSSVDWKMQIGYTVKDNLVPISYKEKAKAINQAEKLNTYSKCRAFNDKAKQEMVKYKKEHDKNDFKIY
jgi:hypothetical protein